MIAKFITTLGLAATLALPLSVSQAAAEEKTDFKVCWSIYVGWMPWGYLEDSGIMDKWAEKYGIDVEIVQINDYVESINQYTAGEYDGCSMTNMDALSIPAGGGVDTTALIVGDYSNGNDGHHPEGQAATSPASRARTSTWSNCRSRTTCWRARSTASACRKRT
jgi:ABC-type nitrate/sulfonate/bicarbonate transport system substrate-binding protein